MSDTVVHIRRATVADAAALASHRMSMFRDMGSSRPGIERELHAVAAEHIRDAIETGEYVAWVGHPAGNPDEIIAGAGVQLRRLLPRPSADGAGILLGPEGIVLNVYVERDWRRRGLARRLMETILEWAPGAGIVRLVLHASDEGRPLYASMGFVPTNEMRYTGDLSPASRA
jgi:GNAT superfamily N-acetyltransferase